MTRKIEFREIDLEQEPTRQAVIIIGQPEWGPEAFEHGKAGFKLQDDKLAQPWIRRTLLKAEEHKANLVIFPELSVPQSYVEEIRLWSESKRTIVVGGSHYELGDGGRFSISPVIVHGQIHKQAKIQLSPSEISSVSRSNNLRSGQEVIIFRNSEIGDFCNLICADYLDSAVRNAIHSLRLDILSVVAFQRSSNRYFTHLEAEVDSREEGIFCVYSNPFVTGLTDGDSALFGVLDKRLYGRDLEKEGQLDKQFQNMVLRARNNHFLAFSLDIANKNPSLRHTHHTRPNIILVETGRFEQKEPFANVAASERPKQDGTEFGNFPIKEQVQSLVARHGYDDPDWVRAFSSMIFLDRLATLLGQAESEDLFAMQDEFLSYFRIKADDKLVLSEERVLVTPEENERILEAMKEEDASDGDYQRYPKLRADNVDISKLHQNYLYAVALGISGNKTSRIMATVRNSVLEHFFANSGADNRDPHGGWAQYRTPWVTARVLINFGRLDREIVEVPSNADEKVKAALTSLVSRVATSGIWKSGAGTWVSDWEATALVLEAFLVNDQNHDFRSRIETVTRTVISKRQEWLPRGPSFVDEESSNESLAAAIMCSVLLRLQEKYLDSAVLEMSDVDDFYGFLSESLTAISSNNQLNTRQFCTIPQVACYCAEVVA